QNRGVRGRDRFEQLKETDHRLTSADDSLIEPVLLVQLSAQVRVLRAQPALFQRGVQHMEQRVDLKGLADEIVSAALDRVHRILERAVTRDDDRDDIWIAFDGRFDDARTVDARETQVGDDDVESEICKTRNGSFPGFCLFNEVTVVGELFGNGLAEWSLVF